MPNARTEIWRKVPDWPYEVSDLGRVRRLGKIKLLKLYKHKRGGYPAVCLCSHGSSRYVFVHILVLETFVCARPAGMEARHFPDNNPGNNRLTNLSWCTSKQNAADRKTHGTQVRGERCHASRFTKEQIFEIRCSNETVEELATRFRVHVVSVRRILRRETWAHV